MLEKDLLLRLRLHMADYHGLELHGHFQDAAVVVAVTARAGDPELLLTKRASHMRLHRGEIAFPGGKVDREDRDLLTTATREMHEEVGIAPRMFEPLGRLRQRVTRTRLRVTPFVGIIPHEVTPEINPGELESAFKVPFSVLMDPGNFQVEYVQYRGRRRQVAHFHVAGHDVWGVTAMIIADLLNSVLGVELPVDVAQR